MLQTEHKYQESPAIGTLADGDVSFRQHAGGHTDGPNWPVFLGFARRSFETPPADKQ